MLSSLRARNINCEQEAKFIQDRIILVERNFAEFCNTFAQYSRKVAKVRDRGDAIAQTALAYSESENINKSLAHGLENFANSITTISDYGDLRVQTIDKKVVQEFSLYESICKQAKDEVKYIFNARDKELSRKKQLDRTRERNPRNRQLIVQAETELIKATADVSRSIQNLEDKITNFERNKINSIKNILLDFISTEIGYHSKALENLTKAYQDIYLINEESDLQDFRRALQIPNTSETLTNTAMKNSQSQSLGSINTYVSKPHRKRSQGIPTSNETETKILSHSVDDLNSSQRTPTESNDSNSELENTSNDSEHSLDQSSPIPTRRYIK